jgi:peptide/nickel transport system substrate-binding protein
MRESDAERPIEILVTSDAETLDPRYVVDSVGMRASRLVHAGLVRLDPTSLEPVPYLASSWTWVDARTLRVALREDVHFHSGALLTPQDVVTTIHAFASASVGSRHARVVEAIESAVVDGPHAVVIRMKRAHATLLTDLELPILRASEAEGPPDPAGRLDGLGPYAVDHLSHGEIGLVPKGDALPLPRRAIVIRTVHDENARALRLIAGRSDIAQNVFSPTLLPALAARSDLTVVTRSGANLTYLLARVDRGTLADVRLREAISLAIDRPTITRTLLAGYAQPARSLVPPNHWAHTEQAELPFDPAAARLRVKARVDMTLLTSTDRARISIARVIAQELADVGIVAEVIPLELGTMIARLNAGDFDAAILQLPEITEPNVFRVFMHSTSIPPVGANRSRMNDPEIDALLDEGDRATDREVRKTAYAKLEARAKLTLAMIPLWHEDQVVVAGPRARAFMPSAEGRWLSLASLP